MIGSAPLCWLLFATELFCVTFMPISPARALASSSGQLEPVSSLHDHQLSITDEGELSLHCVVSISTKHSVNESLTGSAAGISLLATASCCAAERAINPGQTITATKQTNHLFMLIPP